MPPIDSRFRKALSKAEKPKYGNDHHHKPNNPNDLVHGSSSIPPKDVCNLRRRRFAILLGGAVAHNRTSTDFGVGPFRRVCRRPSDAQLSPRKPPRDRPHTRLVRRRLSTALTPQAVAGIRAASCAAPSAGRARSSRDSTSVPLGTSRSALP